MQSYTIVKDINMKFPVVVTPPSIYHISFWWMFNIYILIHPFLLKGYTYYSQNTEGFLEQIKESCIFEKNQQFNSYKTARDFTKEPSIIFKIFLVYDTIQWINCVLKSLNIKINWKLVERIMHSFEVHSNESVCIKTGSLGPEKIQ